jgi:hypothetical protein
MPFDQRKVYSFNRCSYIYTLTEGFLIYQQKTQYDDDRMAGRPKMNMKAIWDVSIYYIYIYIVSKVWDFAGTLSLSTGTEEGMWKSCFTVSS